MSEKFSLKWNEFQGSVCGTFKDVREDEDFSDVTLVSDDDKQMKANKVILAASSPVFRNIIKANRHPHPIIVLRRFKSCYLEYLLDFIYLGEVKVPQEDLKEFLESAEDLKIKGLTEKSLENAQKVNGSTEIKNEEPFNAVDDDDVIEIVDTYAGMKTLADKHAVSSENCGDRYYPMSEIGQSTNNRNPQNCAEKHLSSNNQKLVDKRFNVEQKHKTFLMKPVLTENNRVTLKRTVMITKPANEDQSSIDKTSNDKPSHDELSTVKKPVQFANIQNELNLLEHFEMFESQMTKPQKKNEKRIYSEAFSRSTLSELDPRSDVQEDPILKMFSVREAMGYTCTSCGEFSDQRHIMKRHIQMNHLTDHEHKCGKCGKAFSSRNRLSSHIVTLHSKE